VSRRAPLLMACALAGCAASSQEPAPAPTVTYYLVAESQLAQIEAALRLQRQRIEAQAAQIRHLEFACAAAKYGL